MSRSAIEWTDVVWNPVTGCTKVSQGCKHCYAEVVAGRFWHHQYVHTVERGFIPVKAYAADALTGRPRKFTDVMTHEDRLLEPLRWRKPAKVFVNSMSDLFHEDVPNEFIDRVFAVMARATRHTFQILTKRPERMREYLTHDDVGQRVAELAMSQACRGSFDECSEDWTADEAWNYVDGWPLPNVWIGVSVEDQATSDARIPVLLNTPAALRFVSYEPALGPVDFTAIGKTSQSDPGFSALTCTDDDEGPLGDAVLDWVIVGGESGPGARPFDLAWARSTVGQCQAAGVPVFVKQLGRWPASQTVEAGWVPLCDDVGHLAGSAPPSGGHGKHGDPAEWPHDVRVQEYPQCPQ